MYMENLWLTILWIILLTLTCIILFIYEIYKTHSKIW
jgi:hypothetical protein